MHQKIWEFPTLDSNSTHKLQRTGDTKLVDLWLDMITMYSWTVYLLNCRLGSCITVNHFTALHLLSTLDLIAR
jgi:hypothetical protein